MTLFLGNILNCLSLQAGGLEGKLQLMLVWTAERRHSASIGSEEQTFSIYFIFSFYLFTFVPFFALSSHLFFGSGQWERPFLTRNGKNLTLRPCQEQELGLSPSSKLRQTRDCKCSCFRPSKHWSQFRMPSDPWTSTCWWVYDSFCICEWVYESFLYLRELKGSVATARFKRMSQ